jgi:hypothetical protein
MPSSGSSDSTEREYTKSTDIRRRCEVAGISISKREYQIRRLPYV